MRERLEFYEQVLPFVGMIREDDFGFPAIYLPGSVYVTAGPTRRATGTHYTPRSLTEPIVQHTLSRLSISDPQKERRARIGNCNPPQKSCP